MSTFPFPYCFFSSSIYPHTNLFWCNCLRIICLFKICQKKYFLKDRGPKMKKGAHYIHIDVYMYILLYSSYEHSSPEQNAQTRQDN